MKHVLGLVALLALLAHLILGSMRYGIGRLPGDIAVDRQNFAFYLPITTGVLVSLILSLVFWLFGR